MLFAYHNADWVLENWNWLRWVTLTVIIVVFAVGEKETTGWGRPGVGLTEFINTYPIMKFWLIISTLAVLLYLVYANNSGIKLYESAGTLMIVGFGTMFAPLFILAEYLRFKRLGN